MHAPRAQRVTPPGMKLGLPACAQPAWQSSLLDQWQQRAPWVLDRQIAIAQVAAPTGHEAARAALLLELLAITGDAPRTIDPAGNVIVRIAPATVPRSAAAPHVRSLESRDPLVCLAHLDTVFSSEAPLRATIAGRCVRCPGIGDNSRGLAAMLMLARALQSPEICAQLTRPIALVATVGEEGEGNLRGARAFFDAAERDGERAFAAIAIDGPGDCGIVHHAVGSHRVRIHLAGHGGHSWVNAGTPNPVHAAGSLIASLGRLSSRERPHALVTVSRMGGGETLTSVPHDAWIDVDVRAFDATRLARLRTLIVELATQTAAEESRLAPTLAIRVSFESLGERPAGHLPDSHPLVQLAANATARVGRTPCASSASTDANIPLARGVPAIALGAGGTGGDAHMLSEWFDDTGSDVGLRRLLDVVTTLATAPDDFFG
jgi:acetylornithine deacetylase/succinyl-diaminopimelate desuccinylase-like protein